MEIETKALHVEECASNDGESASCVGGALFPEEPVASGVASKTQNRTKVVFLTVNDVYELFPDVNGVGGLAELATMLMQTKQRISHDTHVIVTLNGDFLYRSELDRRDKGELMVQVLNYLDIEYVVVGNHEFDFGAEYMRSLLADAKFTCFGSNVRSSSSGKVYPGLTDTCVVPLSNGLKLGLFGAVTTATGKDPFAGLSVVFDDERVHARRCIEELQAEGANAIVALTHFKVADDVRLAMQAPGIHLILGGHDHFPVTCAGGNETLIHKSGMDAFWLGAVEMTLTVPEDREKIQVDFQWEMLLNRGYEADPGCLAILNKYVHEVEQEELAQGKLEPLATALVALDGRRITCRTQESNMGNLVTDALREGLSADVGLVNAGYIKGDRLNPPGLVITRKWLEKYLPLLKPTVVVKLSMRELKDALTYWLRRYPEMSSSQPHFSGLRVIYDVSDALQPVISSIRLSTEEYEVSTKKTTEFYQEQDEMNLDQLVTVAMPLLSNMDGWHFFGQGQQLHTGPIVRNLVEQFVKLRPQIDYPAQQGRLRVIESTLSQRGGLKASAL